METIEEKDKEIRGHVTMMDNDVDEMYFSDVESENHRNPELGRKESKLNQTVVCTRKVFRFNPEQRTRLKDMYNIGMRNCSNDSFHLIEKATKETNLTATQVKVLSSI